MDLAVRSEAFQANAMSWLASSHGVDMGQPIELDLALFDIAGVFVNGFLPSGIVLAKRASDGKYGAYDPGTQVNEVQSLIATGGTAGDFTLVVDGEETAAIAYNATAADVQTAILALSNVEAGDIVATGGPLPGTAVVLTFGGKWADEDRPQITVGTENVTNGNAVVTTTTPGGGTGAGVADLTIAKGHLLFPVDVTNGRTTPETTGLRLGALFSRGRVRVANLPTGHGLDSDARAALPLIEYV